MRESFFPMTVLDADRPALPKNPECGVCGLKKSCRRPMLPVSGLGKRKILVVTDKVSDHEEANGFHLAGGDGRLVAEVFRKYGVDLRRDCWTTAASICSYKGRKPPKDLVRHCRPNLLKEVNRLKPEVIVLLGPDAIKSYLGAYWRENAGSEDRWAGYRIPHAAPNAWVCPTYHPTRFHAEKTQVAQLFFERHLEAVSKLDGRPYYVVPHYDADLDCQVDTTVAAKSVSQLVDGKRMIAFDYETTCLKPESKHAEIVTCSVSDGRTSVAFPWHGKVVGLMKEILTDPKIRKIASNAKFEDRWTRCHLGVDVRGWHWDTMLAAHGLENNTKAKEITSIKFQAFAHLGVDAWDAKVAPYLKPKSGNEKLGNAPNRIKEVDLPTLLRYNAFDSLYEFLVAEKQLATLQDINSNEEEGVPCSRKNRPSRTASTADPPRGRS